MYISVDENINSWKNACKQEKLDKSSFSYLLSHFEKSKLKTVFQIQSIPRYIIIGKDGTVINPNAPRPSDPKLLAILEKLVVDKN